MADGGEVFDRDALLGAQVLQRRGTVGPDPDDEGEAAHLTVTLRLVTVTDPLRPLTLSVSR